MPLTPILGKQRQEDFCELPVWKMKTTRKTDKKCSREEFCIEGMRNLEQSLLKCVSNRDSEWRATSH